MGQLPGHVEAIASRTPETTASSTPRQISGLAQLPRRRYSPAPYSGDFVDTSSSNPTPQLTWPLRGALVGSGMLAIGLLATAAWLMPDRRGLGTHQGLGLPPCSVRVLFGIRCPACGMTTAWSHMMRGQVARAVRANASGVCLFVLAAAFGPWALVSGLRGRWWGRRPSDWELLAVSVGVLCLTFLEWALRLVWERGN